MSYLDKVSIQGIRSFDFNKSQVVQFFPLTIILGPNGAGKTTIIEALKYVTTGQTPPNSQTGKTFILDPIIANVATVRAQVKLSFTDNQQKRCVVTRSMELRSKTLKGKPSFTFKSLNSAIKRDNTAIDLRCIDINNEMLELLGVSKAVLSNVIFCHQEDSNWPLSEGKVLKERFDDIFGSMGYVKALDKIKKTRKTELERSKLLQKDVDKCLHIKRQFDDMKSELSRKLTDLDRLKKQFAESETQFRKVKTDLDHILSKEDAIQLLSGRISQKRGTIDEKQNTLQRLKSSITTLFNGSEEELKSEIDNFESNRQKSEENKTRLKNEEKNLTIKYSKLYENLQNLTTSLTKLKVDEENHQKSLEERNQLVSKLVKEINLSFDDNISAKLDSGESLDSNDIHSVLNELNNKLLELNSDLSNYKSSHQKSCEKLSKELNEYKATKSKYEHEVDLWNRQQTDKMKTKKELESKLRDFRKSEAKYNEIEDNIKRLKEEIKQLEGLNIDKKKSDLEQKLKEKKEKKEEINSLENQLKELRQQNEDRIKLEMFTKDKREKERKRTQINEIHSEIIESIDATDGHFHPSLKSRIEAITSQIDTKTKQLSQKENELSSESMKKEMKSQSVLKMKRELKDSETKVRKVCKLEVYENTLKTAENELKELRQRLSESTNYKPFIESQIESIECSNCCPVCERDVNSEWIAKNGTKHDKHSLVKNLENRLKQSSVEEIETKMKSKEKEWNQLNDLRSTVQLIASHKESIAKLEAEIELSEENNSSLKTFIEKEKIQINKQKNELKLLSDVLQDASESDQIWRDIQELDKKIKSFGIDLDSEDKSIDDLSDELEEKKTKLDYIEDKINSIQQIIQTFSENYTKRQNLLNSYEKEKLDLKREEQQMTSYKQKIEELNEDIKLLDQKMGDSQMKAIEIEPKINEIDHQISELNVDFTEMQEKIQIQLNLIKENQRDLERLNTNIVLYSKSGKPQQIEELSQKLSINKKEMSTIESERNDITLELNRLTQELSSFEVRKRELTDNLRVFEVQNEIKSLRIELKTEEEKLGFNNIIELKNKKRELEKQIQKLQNSRTQAEATQIPIIEDINRLEQKLKTEPFKSAENSYKHKFIELVISESSADDLNKYYKALDFAVSDFHRKKIDEINKLVKGFWKQAYKGTDIDYIKIVSDEEERSADKRRTFNYRVVMVKNGIDMDMRGRCSAGQKVLASLIIRLALAEIFCTNCSVLALDEPTTNLDKHNIESFATAVTQIVKYRKKWKNSNFQLIIITHDEEFLRCLDSETGQYYYKVYKNDSGFSTIVRKSIDQNSDNNE